MALAKLLGEKVIKMDGDNEVEVDVSSLEGERKVVGIYFSAHWCPPCRAFTPQLAKWYRRLRDGIVGDRFSIIFASSDRDEESFKDYFKTMPWLALPFADRERKSDLSKKYKVSGIPTLVLVDASNGKFITGDGRSVVMEDDNGRDFPWTPKPFLEVVSDGKLKGQRGKEVDAEAIKGKVIGLYFSAHWCGPCRNFTPKMVEIYKNLNKDGKKFEVVYVSSDKDENEYKKYFAQMPWLGIPYGDKRKKILSRMFDVQGIPTLVILDEHGEIINEKARGALEDDKEGAKFPWYPEPVRQLSGASAADINEYPSFLWFDEKTDKNEMMDIVRPIAKAKIAEAKAAEEDQMMFYVVGSEKKGEETEDDDIPKSLRKFAGLGDRSPVLVIIDIPAQNLYICDTETYDADSIQKFVDGYYNKSIEAKPLRA